MGAQSDRASLGGSGSIGIYRIGQAETPADVLDFGSSGSAMGALNELKKRGDLRWNKQDYRHDFAYLYWKEYFVQWVQEQVTLFSFEYKAQVYSKLLSKSLITY